jgi:hypothetical protein
MPANTIPGYIMGHRFSDDSAHYNSGTKRFLDKAGYGSKADLRVTVGDPVFETVNSQRGARLNNTWHGLFASPVPWQGSAIFVVKPWMVGTTTQNKYPILFGDSATANANGALQLVHTSAQRRLTWTTASAQLANTLQRTDDNAVVVAFSISQEARTGYRSSDGITVSTQAGPASTVNGNAIAMGSARFGARFGNLNAVAGDTTEETVLTCTFFEQHFFSENILTGDNLALTAAFIAELKTQYGAS